MSTGRWYPHRTMTELLTRDPSLCGRPTVTGVPCRRHRLSAVHVKIDEDYMRYEAAACPGHATDAERLEHDHMLALAEDQLRECHRREPVACWAWPVNGDHRKRKAESDACRDPEEAHILASELLTDWQAGRCAICGSGRGEVDDHDHATGLVRGMLCRSCNTLEAFAYLPGNCFERYRAKNPASILGLTIRYFSPFTGWAKPEVPYNLDRHPAHVLATRFGARKDT